MEVTVLERRTFDLIKQRIMEMNAHLRTMCRRNRPGEQWLDNEDVCRRLNISKGTLQTLRDKGRIGYSMVGHKCFYKTPEVDKFLQENYKEANLNSQNYL